MNAATPFGVVHSSLMGIRRWRCAYLRLNSINLFGIVVGKQQGRDTAYF